VVTLPVADGRPPTRRTAISLALPIAGLSAVGFALLSLLYYDFVLDDAYIIYRYARNLADAHTLAWNVGDAPVEGFTSFLWVVLNAGAIVAGLDPIVFSKALSVAAAMVIIWMLAMASHRLPRPLAFVVVWAVALNAPFVFLTWQGLETTFVALLLLATSLLSVRLLRTPSAGVISGWYLFAFLAALTRPDSVVFTAGVVAGVLAVLAWSRDWTTIRRVVTLAVPWVVLGVAFIGWRWNYFGYPLPNTFYVKARPAAGFSQLEGTGYEFQGLEYATSFAAYQLFPYVVLPVIALATQGRVRLNRVVPAIPILLGCLGLGAYALTIIPIQGFFWRFLFPMFPAFLLALIVCLSPSDDENIPFRSWPVGWVLVPLFAAWSLYQTPQGLFEKRFRSQESRVQVGMRLAGLDGTMLIEDSGAIPYYSGWRTADILGLVSAEITHQGLSRGFLERLNPDVICIYIEQRAFNSGRSYGERGRIIMDFMLARDFVAVAVIHKTYNNWNYYFVRRGSPLFAEVVERLLTVPGVTYGELEKMMAGEAVPIYVSRGR
jgi:hypothetical protein